MEELRRGREGAQVAESGLQRDPSMHRTRAVRWPFATEQIIRLIRESHPGRRLGISLQ
jgi:hypothetical protein